MAIKLFVAGLPFTMTDNDLRDMFTQYGTVVSTQVVIDRDNGRSKGFGFVELATESEGQAAIAGLDKKDMDGRPLTVSVARPREQRPARSFQNHSNTAGNDHRHSHR